MFFSKRTTSPRDAMSDTVIETLLGEVKASCATSKQIDLVEWRPETWLMACIADEYSKTLPAQDGAFIREGAPQHFERGFAERCREEGHDPQAITSMTQSAGVDYQGVSSLYYAKNAPYLASEALEKELAGSPTTDRTEKSSPPGFSGISMDEEAGHDNTDFNEKGPLPVPTPASKDRLFGEVYPGEMLTVHPMVVVMVFPEEESVGCLSGSFRSLWKRLFYRSKESKTEGRFPSHNHINKYYQRL